MSGCFKLHNSFLMFGSNYSGSGEAVISLESSCLRRTRDENLENSIHQFRNFGRTPERGIEAGGLMQRGTDMVPNLVMHLFNVLFQVALF